MDDFKLAFIYGQNIEDKNIYDGKIEKYGKISDDSLHIVYLLEYIKNYLSEYKVFKQFNKNHPPTAIAHFMTKLGYVIFFNTTKDVKKYGKTGFFVFPENLTENQIKSILEFSREIKDYDIEIDYNTRIEDGIMNNDSLVDFNGRSPEELLKKYFEMVGINLKEKTK